VAELQEMSAAPRTVSASKDEEDRVPAPPRGPASLLKQIVRYAPGSVVPAALAVVWAVLFTRLFSAGEYGRYALALSIASLVAGLLSQWLYQGVTRFVPGESDPGRIARLKEAIAGGIVFVSLLGLALGALLYLVVGGRLAGEWERLVLPGVALAIVTAAFLPLGGLLQAEFRAGRHSLYQLLGAVLRLGLALGLVLLVRDPGMLLWGSAAALALLIPFQWRDGGLPLPRLSRQALAEQRASLRELLSYGLPMAGWVFAGSLLDVGDRYVIQAFRGEVEVGIYGANYSLVANAMLIAAAPVLLAAHPMLIRAWNAGDGEGAARWLGMIVHAFMIAGLLLVAVVAVFSTEIVLLLGESFREGHRVLPVALAGGVLWQLGMYSHKPLEFRGRTGLMFAIGIVAAAVNIGLNLLLVPRFGYMAAAYTTVVSFGLYLGITTWVGRRTLQWRLFDPRVAAVAVVCILGGQAAGFARESLAGWPAPAVVMLLTTATALWLSRDLLLRLRGMGAG
jgi:O-antigen/teichoic acid export membrane protein